MCRLDNSSPTVVGLHEGLGEYSVARVLLPLAGGSLRGWTVAACPGSFDDDALVGTDGDRGGLGDEALVMWTCTPS